MNINNQLPQLTGSYPKKQLEAALCTGLSHAITPAVEKAKKIQEALVVIRDFPSCGSPMLGMNYDSWFQRGMICSSLVG